MCASEVTNSLTSGVRAFMIYHPEGNGVYTFIIVQINIKLISLLSLGIIESLFPGCLLLWRLV